MKKMHEFRKVILFSLFVPGLYGGPPAAAADPAVKLVIDTSRTLGPIDLTRYTLGQGGLSEQPMISDRIEQIRQLHPQTINFFVQEYFDLYPAHHQYHWVTLDKAIEAVLATGAKPIMNLTFKPKVLYPKVDDQTTDPTDYSELEELIIRNYFVNPSTFSRFMSAPGTAFMAHWWNEMPQYDGLYDNQDRVRPAITRSSC